MSIFRRRKASSGCRDRGSLGGGGDELEGGGLKGIPKWKSPAQLPTHLRIEASSGGEGQFTSRRVVVSATQDSGASHQDFQLNPKGFSGEGEQTKVLLVRKEAQDMIFLPSSRVCPSVAIQATSGRTRRSAAAACVPPRKAGRSFSHVPT